MTEISTHTMTTEAEPGERECLRCYVARMVDRHHCDGTRQWTTRWRDRRAPADQRLLAELADRGGLCCDCEVLFNVWESAESDWEDEQEAGQPMRCAGVDAQDPLTLCALWAGLWLRDPHYAEDEDDDEDDYFG